MGITVDSSRTRVTAVNDFGGNPVTLTDSSITVPAGALLVAVVNCSEGTTTNAMLSTTVTTSGLTWTTRGERGTASNGGGATSLGYVYMATAPDSAGGTRSVQAVASWSDNFTGYRASLKVYIVTGQHASPIGATGSAGPVQTPAAGAEYTPTLFTATGEGRAFYAATEQNGSSGSDGICTSTDTEDAAYHAAELMSVFSAIKASDHVSGSISGSIDPTAQTYVNWIALEILAAASAPTLSAATVTSIGDTTATPRVTITFP